jgi:hypothetical protein
MAILPAVQAPLAEAAEHGATARGALPAESWCAAWPESRQLVHHIVARPAARWMAGGDARRAGIEFRQRPQPASVYEIRRQLRRVFALVSEFHVLCRLPFEARCLADLLGAIHQEASYAFELAGTVRAGDFAFAADCRHCLHDLAQWRQDLQVGRRPTAPDLAHALDILIVRCVLMDDGSDNPPSSGA